MERNVEKMENEKVFIEITNKDIWDEIQTLKKIILGNGKKGLKDQIQSSAIHLKIIYGFLGALCLYLGKSLIGV